ncbi:MAG: hypothetical protein JRN15_03955, partial [Nitrososphaerota archaeon]|nr:hypothetical protein [Nitrososphaerota archaeon]
CCIALQGLELRQGTGDKNENRARRLNVELFTYIVITSMAKPLLLKWDKCRWESKNSVITQDRKNTIEAHTTKIPILVQTPGNGIM